jgi:EAL domain-containing protein (putative c-di-GMP-specific phosphodiesterase class I)
VYVTPSAAPKLASPVCAACRETGPGIDFSFAFQPIVDVERGDVFAYEALVRGTGGESAASILTQVEVDNVYRFDQAIRVRALELAARMNLRGGISINFLPNAVYRPELCIRTTLEAAERLGFPISNIMFEVSEMEHVTDRTHLTAILREYKRQGFLTAIDDFGSGWAGLGLLAEFQPDFLKIDMDLVRNIEASVPRQVIVRSTVDMCRSLDVQIIAEGVETVEEYRWLRDAGITLFQGYLFAKPAFEALPSIHLPEYAAARRLLA